ncbi:hypothetical protein ACVWWO_006370 [Bradyrhizobium sp. F1.13.1]
MIGSDCLAGGLNLSSGGDLPANAFVLRNLMLNGTCIPLIAKAGPRSPMDDFAFAVMMGSTKKRGQRMFANGIGSGFGQLFRFR